MERAELALMTGAELTTAVQCKPAQVQAKGFSRQAGASGVQEVKRALVSRLASGQAVSEAQTPICGGLGGEGGGCAGWTAVVVLAAAAAAE